VLAGYCPEPPREAGGFPGTIWAGYSGGRCALPAGVRGSGEGPSCRLHPPNLGLSLEARPAGGRLPHGIVTATRSVPSAERCQTGGAWAARPAKGRRTSPGCCTGAGGRRPCFGAGWPAGCAALRLGRHGGCLSLSRIMSSERNASAYE